MDFLRGFAVLGILVMNVQTFAMIEAVYSNPTAFGDLTGVNRWVWLLSHVLVDQKFMTIFSLLFGAGIALSAQKLQAQGRSQAGGHYRRMASLLAIGMVHAYLFWYGDILVTYALVGAVAFLFRKLRPGWLLCWGCLALAVPFLLFLGIGATIPFWPEESLRELRSYWQPGDADIAEQLGAMRGGFAGQIVHRFPLVLVAQTGLLFAWTGWRTGGLMLIGMALLKWSVLSGEKPVRFYLKLAAAGAAFGFPLVVYGVLRNFQEQWSLHYSLFLGSQWNYCGSLGVALSYVALLMLVHKTGLLAGLRRVLGAVGRMSLTNYLLQTLICTTLFYGHGFGLFGRLERWQQALVVLGVWALQISFTLLWLRRFRQGPFEWLWRSLGAFKFR